MARTRIDSRIKIAIEWYDNEAEARKRAVNAIVEAERRLDEGYDFGYMTIGMEPSFDVKDDLGNVTEWAVVVP